jgi:hypothetical protein
LALFSPKIHIAAPNAPQAPPLKPMPPANPAAMTACKSDAPAFLASMAAQLTGDGGASDIFSGRAELISANAILANLAAMPKHLNVPPLMKYLNTFIDFRQSVSVSSRQLISP